VEANIAGVVAPEPAKADNAEFYLFHPL